jgi:hypothetical protein
MTIGLDGGVRSRAKPVSNPRTGNFLKFRPKTGFRWVLSRWSLENRLRFKSVTRPSKQFPVIPQNRRLRCENRRCKAQYQTSETFEQVTIRRESRKVMARHTLPALP